MDRVLYDVLIGSLVALLTIAAKWQWHVIRSLFDKESRRQAQQITGKWEAVETFSDGAEDNFTMELHCRGGKVTGTHYCTTGYDEGKEYDVDGTYKDHILTFRWTPKYSAMLDSGTVTVRLSKDRTLEGHGLYIEPDDGKVYTSVFKATMKT